MSDGLCACGCGKKTWVATYNSPHHGYVKGEPVRFRRGHNGSNNKGGRMTSRKGHVLVWDPSHRMARDHGYVFEHRAVADDAMGGRLPDGAPVHHADGDPANNEPSNLVVCEDNAYHRLLHQRMRAKDACGDPSWRKCNYCGEYDDPANLRIYAKAVCHAECSRRHNAKRREVA